MVDFRFVTGMSDLVIHNEYTSDSEGIMRDCTFVKYSVVSFCREVMISQIFHDLYINMTQGIYTI